MIGKHRPRGGNAKGDFDVLGNYKGKIQNKSELEKAKEKYPVKPPMKKKKVDDAPTDNFNAGLLRKYFTNKKK